MCFTIFLHDLAEQIAVCSTDGLAKGKPYKLFIHEINSVAIDMVDERV